MNEIKKHIILKADNCGFYIDEILNVNEENSKILFKDLNPFFINNVIKSGLNPETVFIKISNYEEVNFKHPCHDNFSALFFNTISHQLCTYYHNTLFNNSSFLFNFMNTISNFCSKEKLPKEGFIFYGEPFQYMKLLTQNRVEEAIYSIFEENNNLPVLCACAFNYGIDFFIESYMNVFINNDKFMEQLNLSKGKVNFFSHLYVTNNNIYNSFKNKIIFKEEDLVNAFKLIVKGDLTSKLDKVECFVKDDFFTNHISNTSVKKCIDIIDSIKFKEEIYINNIKKIIKMKSNIHNF